MSRASAFEHGTESARRFDSLFDSHHEAVLRYCVRRLGPTEAEDAAADVFAIAWRRLDEMPMGDSARAWLIGVAYKTVGNRYRSRRRRIELQERLRAERSTSEVNATDLDTQTVHLALSELSESDRELIRLSSWDGLSRAEIAQVLGIRVNAVDQRLHRARTRLKTQFDRIHPSVAPTRPEEASL